MQIIRVRINLITTYISNLKFDVTTGNEDVPYKIRVIMRQEHFLYFWVAELVICGAMSFDPKHRMVAWFEAVYSTHQPIVHVDDGLFWVKTFIHKIIAVRAIVIFVG